jgi:hypothetical protein
MFFHRTHNLLLPQSQPAAESDAIELRIVRRLYTYFGWFPWADFEGENVLEETVYGLTGGRAGASPSAIAPGAEADPDEEVEPHLR